MSVAAAGGALMRAEIHEQPARWRELLGRRDELDAAVRLLTDVEPQLIVFAAAARATTPPSMGSTSCTSGWACRAARHAVRGDRPRCPAAVAAHRDDRDLAIGLVARHRGDRRRGTRVGGRRHRPDQRRAQPLALRADAHVPLSAGDERAVAATKTYTAEIAALHQIIGGAAGVPWSARTDLLRRAADAVELHLELHDDGLDAAAI